MLKNLLDRYGKYIVLGSWAIIALLLMRHTPYALDEAASKALLLDWSISDEVASSVLTMGMPDLRALIWLPLAYLFSGQVLAAKIFTILLLAFTAWQLYQWLYKNGQEEAALLATGLLLIAPLSIQQLDSLSVGVYLLASFALGHWMHSIYHEQVTGFNGYFFAQLALCAFAVSLHPAGLAYPISLLWLWHTKPLHINQQRYFYIGIPLSVILILLLTLGWSDLHFWSNPVQSIVSILWGAPLEPGLSTEGWVLGFLLLALGIAILTLNRKILPKDILSCCLILGPIAGIVAADQAWAFLMLALFLFAGLPILLRPYPVLLKHGFLVQRGWLWVLLLIVSSLFMRGDRFHYYEIENKVLSAQDQLIQTFADDLNAFREQQEANKKPMPSIRVASQWPAITMIACRCDVLPLPPTANDPAAQLAMLQNINFLILAPTDPKNLSLASNLARLSNDVATQSLQAGGVILAVKPAKP
jgi:hypothetical protein